VSSMRLQLLRNSRHGLRNRVHTKISGWLVVSSFNYTVAIGDMPGQLTRFEIPLQEVALLAQCA